MKAIAKPSQRPRSTRSKSPDLSANRKFVQRNGNVCVNLEKIPVFDFSECPLSNRKKIRAVARYLFFPRSRNVVGHQLKSRQVEVVKVFRRRRDVVVFVVSVHGPHSRLVHNVCVYAVRGIGGQKNVAQRNVLPDLHVSVPRYKTKLRNYF
jgi:hypothetical protein